MTRLGWLVGMGLGCLLFLALFVFRHSSPATPASVEPDVGEAHEVEQVRVTELSAGADSIRSAPAASGDAPKPSPPPRQADEIPEEFAAWVDHAWRNEYAERYAGYDVEALRDAHRRAKDRVMLVMDEVRDHYIRRGEYVRRPEGDDVLPQDRPAPRFARIPRSTMKKLVTLDDGSSEVWWVFVELTDWPDLLDAGRTHTFLREELEARGEDPYAGQATRVEDR